MLNVRWSISNQGSSTIEVQQQDRWFPLHSRYDPHKEAQRIVEKIPHRLLYIVWGAGAFYLSEALEKAHPECRVLVFEPFQEIIDLSCLHRPQACPKHLQLFRPTHNLLDNIYNPCFDLSVELVESPGYNTIFSELSKSFKNKLQTELTQRFNDYRIQAHFGRRWLYCLGQNLRHYLSHKHNKKTQNYGPLFKQHSGPMLVGAGASLDTTDSLAIFANNSQRPLVCADTSLGWCISHGRNPDAIISIDAQHYSQSHLHGLQALPKLALLDPACHPSYFRRLDNTGILPSPHPFYQAVCQLGSLAPLPFLDTGGNVGQTMVATSLLAGCTEFIVGGLDFCYQSHSPYARPSLLHTAFHSCSDRCKPASQYFEQLWLNDGYSSPQGSFHTPRLDTYQHNFNQLLSTWDCEVEDLGSGWKKIISKQTCQTNFLDLLEPAPHQLFLGIKRLQNLLGHHPQDYASHPDLELCRWIISPVLASIQRRHLEQGHNPADTLTEDYQSAWQLHLNICTTILEGFDYVT
jgi:hypothetical protein